MGNTLKVVGFDPSLRNWGIASGDYNLSTGELALTGLTVAQPVAPKGKQVRQSSKDLVCAEQLTEAAIKAAKGAHAVFVETPIGSQSASAMKGYGVCIGVLGALRAGGISYFELTPTEVKMASVGQQHATKQQMIDWAMEHYPSALWPMQTVKGKTSVIAGKAEHMADAVAAIRAGLLSPMFRQLCQMTA